MDDTKITLIAAMSENRVIGKGPDIPWHIPGEQRRFRNLTMGRTVIMGRKTFESIGKALPGRKTIIVTRNHTYSASHCLTAHSLRQVLQLCAGEREIFIAGGSEVYKMFMPLAETIYLTVIQKTIDGDIFFPEIPSGFTETESEEVRGETPYIYRTLIRTDTLNQEVQNA